MNTTTNGKPLSGYLQAMIKADLVEESVAAEANELPTHELQEKALDRYRDEKPQLMKRIVSELLDQASGKIIADAMPSPAPLPLPQPAPVMSPQPGGFVSAIREDLLDRYFPAKGRVGSLIRQHISQGWDSGQKKMALKWFAVMALAWFLWAPFLWVLRSPLRWYHHLVTSEVRSEFRNLQTPQTSEVVPPESTLPVAVEAVAPVPPPQQAVVASVPAKVVSLPVKQSPAPEVITQNASNNQTETKSKPSFLNSMTRNLVKNSDSVIASAVPIAPWAQGINATKNAALAAHDESSSAKPAVVPVPAGLRVEKQPDNYVQLMWDSLGAGYRYNYYSAYAGQPNTFEIENNTPLATAATPWRPYDTAKVYWVAVTAVDSNGRESARSKTAEVDLR